jgi:hypothetical protein
MVFKLPKGVTRSTNGDVTFAGKEGRQLLLGVLLRAKFARPLERHAVLNEWMAELANDLAVENSSVDIGADPEFRSELAACILTDAISGGLPWWTMTEDEREAVIRDAVAPHQISKFNAEEIVLAIQDEVLRAERLLNIVAKTK